MNLWVSLLHRSQQAATGASAMYLLPGCIAFLTLLADVKCGEPKPTPLPVRAKIKVIAGEARHFSGEAVELSCSIPDQPVANWTYHWFRNEVLLLTSAVYSLQNTVVQQGGAYSCSGEKAIDTWPYSVQSLRSEPLTVHVDGGWALLQVPSEPLLIEDSMTLTCRIRDDPVLVEVIFYKDGVEIKKLQGKDLVIPKLQLEDKGTYWCRATWVEDFDYHSAQSLPADVTVLDKLNTPVLELEPDTLVEMGKTVVLRCLTQLNVKDPGLRIDYYFLKDNSWLGRASSSNTRSIPNVDLGDAGVYTCKVRVRALHLERLSGEVELKVKPNKGKRP